MKNYQGYKARLTMYQQQNLQKVAPARQTPKPKAVTDKLRRNQIERQFREREKENEL